MQSLPKNIRHLFHMIPIAGVLAAVAPASHAVSHNSPSAFLVLHLLECRAARQASTIHSFLLYFLLSTTFSETHSLKQSSFSKTSTSQCPRLCMTCTTAEVHGQEVCAALQVGGVDQLLELVETGVGITEHKTRSYPLAIYYGEDDQPEVPINCVVTSVDNTDVHVT